MKTTSLDSGSKLKYFSLFAASGRRMERGREAVTRLKTKESRGGSEAMRGGWKEKRRTEERRDLNRFNCSVVVVVVVDQVAKSIRPQNLLRTRVERGQGEIEKLVSQTFVHLFQDIIFEHFP